LVPWSDCVIPFVVEIGAFDADARHFGFRDDDALGIAVGVEFAKDLQASFCGCRGDQINGQATTDQGFGAPVLGDEREQTVLCSLKEPIQLFSDRPLIQIAGFKTVLKKALDCCQDRHNGDPQWISQMKNQTLIYPVLGSVYDLWFIRLSGAGIGNCFYSYFHSYILSRQHDATLIAPPWPSLKLGTYLRNEVSKRHYLNLFAAQPDELGGVEKFKRLVAHYRGRTFIDIKPGVRPTISRDGLNFVRCKNFTFEGLHEHRDAIRSRLLAIAGATTQCAPAWGKGGYLGVHVRLGDFAPPQEGRADAIVANTRLPLTWYTSIIRAIKAKYPDMAIRIFSDGREDELSALLDCGGVLYRTGSDLGDLIALAGASVLIGSNSTYSKWAAFLGDMPSVWASVANSDEKPTSPEVPINYIPLHGLGDNPLFL
jgi:hypothetical protein